MTQQSLYYFGNPLYHRTSKQWEGSITLGEYYCRHNVTCHLHIIYWQSRDNGPMQLCAQFYRSDLGDKSLAHLKGERRTHNFLDKGVGAVDGAARDTQSCQKSVFVGVRKISKDGESVTFIRSFVRLIPLYHCPVVRVQISNPPATVFTNTASFKGGFAVFDGELDSSLVYKIASGIPHGELKYELVEGRPKIVEDVPHNDAVSLEGVPHIRNVIDIENMFTGCQVEFNADSWTF